MPPVDILIVSNVVVGVVCLVLGYILGRRD